MIKFGQSEYLHIILTLIMASTVLIIPIAQQTTHYSETARYYHSYAENTKDENVKEQLKNLGEKYEGKTTFMNLSLIGAVLCALWSVFGIFSNTLELMSPTEKRILEKILKKITLKSVAEGGIFFFLVGVLFLASGMFL